MLFHKFLGMGLMIGFSLFPFRDVYKRWMLSNLFFVLFADDCETKCLLRSHFGGSSFAEESENLEGGIQGGEDQNSEAAEATDAALIQKDIQKDESEGANANGDGITATKEKDKSFAKECAPLGIRCNALLPGLTKTKFAGALFEHEDIYKEAMTKIPMGRHAEPAEMAGTVLYLVSDASSYTNGECIVVDGGLTL